MGDPGREDARPPGPAPHRDAGLQPERTRLAWRRSSLSATVVAVLAGRQLVRSGAPRPVEVLGTALLGLMWLMFVVIAHRRMRVLAAARPAGLPPRTALLLGGGTVALAVFGAAILLPGH
ncbi:DUF202 domain-containing protein [Streptomyces celluloflavus]|uniref:DUF202 domain-containing protein n=1 Tax=Streptomyces celluloflavus TaxID=58344 RepID=UPI00368AA0EF